MTIVPAKATDAERLTLIAQAAKRSWGYPESWMACWSAALTITPDFIRSHTVFMAQDADAVPRGFGAVILHGDLAILEHIWVSPEAMGKGVGSALFAHAENIARGRGAVRLTITGDPHAEAFYHRMGAQTVGWEAATMDGLPRFLPLLGKIL